MIGYNEKLSHKISKLSEAQIVQILDQYSTQNSMLSSILESVQVGLLIVDTKWHAIYTNKAMLRYIPFATSVEDALNDKTKVFKLIKDEQIASFLENCAVTNKTNVSNEFTVVTAGDKVRFITISITPFVHKDEIEGSVIVLRDITEKRNQEVLIHRMENLASLTNLAASVAHEIKNPLAAISIHIQLIQKALSAARSKDGMLPDPKFMENYLNVVNEEIETLNKVVVDFLFAVRPVSASLELLDPDSLLERIKTFIQPEFDDKNISIDFSLNKDRVRVLIDDKLFRQIIVNFTQNAIHAISENSNLKPGEGKLKIASSVKDDKYILTVSDNGIGMSAETVSRIFEPYYTTKANGTGLGLTMVYKIIKEFKGEINVTSKPEKGTTFTITLPLPQLDTPLLSFADRNEK